MPFNYTTSCDGIIGHCYLGKFILKHQFTLNGRDYKITGTRSTGKGVYDCIDTVKNDRGEYKDFNRTDLINMIENEKKKEKQQ